MKRRSYRDIVVIGPLSAQVPSPGRLSCGWPQPTPAQRYPFLGVTPEVAYRRAPKNRWQLKRYEKATPQALKGLTFNGARATREGVVDACRSGGPPRQQRRGFSFAWVLAWISPADASQRPKQVM